MSTDMVSSATDIDFSAQVLKSTTPVLVDFWGEWCGPCKAIAPMLDDLAREYSGRMKIVKVELDKNQQTAMTWHVRSAPTLLLFKNGGVAATQFGAVSKSQLVQMIDRAL